MFTLYAPNFCEEEVRYISSVILGDFLGIAFELSFESRSDFKLYHCDGRFILIDASFFASAHENWGGIETEPDVSGARIDIPNWAAKDEFCESHIPVFFGSNTASLSEEGAVINFDLFGTCFFFLSGYEELLSCQKDQHCRVLARYSRVGDSKHLSRPLVNEYANFLAAFIFRLWCPNRPPKRTFRMAVSCDVDFPYDLSRDSWSRTLLSSAAALLRDRRPETAIYKLVGKLGESLGVPQQDRTDSAIDWIMDKNYEAGNEVCFFLICRPTSVMDPWTSKVAMRLPDLANKIVARGHSLGVHPGYSCIRDEEALVNSVNDFKELVTGVGLGVGDKQIISRMHYLRWDGLKTARQLSGAGVAMDTSVAYADMAGFRAGTCFDYPMFCLSQRIQLGLRQQPLIVMDGTLFNPDYEGLTSDEEVIARASLLKDRCRQFSGTFSLLWHNTTLRTESERQIYQTLIR